MIISHKSPSAKPRINSERTAEMRGGFLFPDKGAVFQTDELSVDLIIGRVTKLLAMKALGQEPAPFIWRDKADTDHTFSSDEFLQFFVALDAFMEGKMIESWQKKASL